MTRYESIMGLDVNVAHPCRCGCATIRICPHSSVSDLLVWKCAWCGKRKGKPTDDEIEALVEFVEKFDWNMRPLRFDEDTGGFCV
jgi:hypothetical protein